MVAVILAVVTLLGLLMFGTRGSAPVTVIVYFVIGFMAALALAGVVTRLLAI